MREHDYLFFLSSLRFLRDSWTRALEAPPYEPNSAAIVDQIRSATIGVAIKEIQTMATLVAQENASQNTGRFLHVWVGPIRVGLARKYEQDPKVWAKLIPKSPAHTYEQDPYVWARLARVSSKGRSDQSRDLVRFILF